MTTQVRPTEGDNRGLGLSRAPCTGGRRLAALALLIVPKSQAVEARVDI